MSNRRLVLIEWEDSYGCTSSWEVLDEQNEVKKVVAKSVGWVFKETEYAIVVVPHIAQISGATDQGCGDMTIHKSAIVRQVELAGTEEESDGDD